MTLISVKKTKKYFFKEKNESKFTFFANI